MRVSTDEASKFGSSKPHNRSPTPRIRRSDNHQHFPHCNPLKGSNDAVQALQQPAQVDGSNPPPAHHGRDRQLLLRLYADCNGLPGNLKLETAPILGPSKKVLLDALTPIVYDAFFKSPGMDPTESHATTASTYLALKGGRTKPDKMQIRLPIRKKRSQSQQSTSSGKRRKPSTKYPHASVDHLSAEAGHSERDPADVCHNDESDEDEGWVVVEEETDQLRSDDRKKITEYFRNVVAHLGQTELKHILKAWIKLLEPGKQTRHPYNGGSSPSGDPDNPGRDTAPIWWCEQAHWRTGQGCRHKEPDHLTKKERLFLVPKILRLTRAYDERDFTVQRMKKSTDELEMSPERRALLKELYRVRADEQAFEEGERDGEDVTYVQKLQTQPTKGRKKKPIESAGAENQMNQTCADTSGSVAQMTETQTTAGTAGSIYSSFNSTLSPVMVKCESQQRNAEHTATIQASLPEHGAIGSKDDMFDPGDRIDPGTELDEIFTRNKSLEPDGEGFAHLVSDQPGQEPAGCNDRSMGIHIGYSSASSVLTDQVPVRPRPTSVANGPSSSYQYWPASMDHWSFVDDAIFAAGQPRSSVGWPEKYPPVPQTAPSNHPHGLPWDQQLLVCVENGCPVSHTHGWRPAKEQQRICAAYGCNLDPRDAPLCFVDPRHPLPDAQFFTPSFDEFAADVTKSLPS